MSNSSSAPAEPEEKSSLYAGKRNSPSNNNKSAAAADSSTDRSLFHSIAAHQSVLLPNKMTTLVIYIPTSSVGAVIGRKGQNITALQKMAAATTTSSNNAAAATTTTTTANSSGGMYNPRVSVVGPSDPPDSIPYTYSTLDWSDADHWTPVVIRAGDAVAALTAATRILALTKDVHDGVVMDLPLAAHKHAALVGKKGLQLANLSADHGVRIFVPPREQKDDIIQLEGSLGQIKRCLRDLLVAVASKSPTATQQKVIVLREIPPASRLRQIQRRTETFVRKKKMESVVSDCDNNNANDDGDGDGGSSSKNTRTIMVWQLTITGSTTERVEWAADLLQGKMVSKQQQQQQQQQSPPRRSNSDTILSAAGNTSSSNADGAPRRRGRGRGRGKNSSSGPGTPYNNSSNIVNKVASDGGSPNSDINKSASSDGGSPGSSYNNKEEEEEKGLET